MIDILKSMINEALSELFGLKGVSFSLEQPAESSHGDYATNVALVIAKDLGANPLIVAEKIVFFLNQNKDSFLEKVSVAGPGFINFELKREVFAENIKNILEEGKNWGRNSLFENKKILVEHSSPNLFKPFHIGHLMNNTIGESIVRLAKFSGAEVTSMTFPSDISLGIAKAVFVILERLEKDPNYHFHDVSILGEAYVEGTKRYEEEGIQERIKEIANNLYAAVDSPEFRFFQEAKKINIQYFEKIVKSLGSHFDDFVYESEAGIVGKEIVLENTPDVFTESEGAIVYIPDESRKDINTAVFINSQGNPTYEAKDLGLLKKKFDKFNPDLSIFVTDKQQTSHFEVVLDAASHINPRWSDKSLHIPHGRMSFKGQKMSSRLGGVPVVEDILKVVEQDVLERNRDIAQKESFLIALSALKFSILRSTAGKDIDFDPESSLSFEGDSGPYLLYSTVRARSVLNKKGNIELSSVLPENWQPTLLERELAHFPEIIDRATKEWAPHYIISFLLKLARTFNSWYGNTQIIVEGDATSGYKLALTSAFAQTVENGLNLLGMEVPEKM